MKRTAAVLTLTVLLVSASIPVSTAAGSAQQNAYAGSHVAFETTSNAVVDYEVDGEQTIESVRVQSQSETESNLGIGASVDVVTSADIAGAALSLGAQTDAKAAMTTESGARIEGHDNTHGTLLVTAEEESQYVAVNLSESSEARQVSDDRVVFTTENGTEATAMVVGDGNVTVSEAGNLTASLAQDSRLAVRTYSDERTSEDESEEEMIVDGTAAASVYLMEQSEGQVTDTVNYTQDTTVDVQQRSQSRVNMTVSRSAEEGRVVITHLSNETVETAEDLEVRVDGEAAVRASSYTEVRQATNGGDGSKYVVRSAGSASATTDVVLGINHFSTRAVTMGSGDETSSDDETESATDTETESSSDDETESNDETENASGNEGDGGSAETTTGSGPGFGIVGGLLALIGGSGLAMRRRR